MFSDKKNSFWLSIQFVLMLLISLITLKLNLSNFGNHTFGLWILFASIWGLGSALDFGFGTALVKYVAEYNKYRKEELNKLLSTSFFVFLIAAFLLFGVGNLIAELFFFQDDNLITEGEAILFRKVFLILGFSFIIQYLTIFFKSTMEGLNNFVLSSRINMFYNIIILAGVITVTILKESIIYLSFVYLASWLFTLLIYVVMVKIRYPSILIKRNNFNLASIKSILGFSFSVQLTSVFSALIDPAIKYIIGSFFQVSFVSSYEIARRFAVAISGLFFAAFKIVLPKVSVLNTREDYKKFIFGEGLNFSKMGLTYSGLVFGIFSFVIVAVISWWFNAEEAIIVFLLLALPESINNVGFTNYTFLVGIGKAHIIAFIQLINVIIISGSLILGFVLFDSIFGLLGYFFTVLLVNGFILLYMKNIMDFSIISYLHKIGIYKLFLLLAILFVSPIIIYQNIAPLYFTLALISVISFFSFGTDLKEYSGIFYKYLMGRNG